MGDYSIEHETLANLGDAVRTVVGSGEQMTPVEMAEALNNYEPPSGGGSDQVIFIDYDGTVLYSYTATEFQRLSELPENPSHDGLVAKGWNWTKAQINARLTTNPDAIVHVGQMYMPESGDTEIDISLPEGRTAPYLGCAVNGTISIDWGDGSTESTVTGTSLTEQIRTQHTYLSAGEYTITIHVESGSMAFYCTSAYPLLNNNSSGISANRVYSSCVVGVRIGKNTGIGERSFSNCHSLKFITISESVTSIGAYAFDCCYSLTSIIIPGSVTSISESAFQYCNSLAIITIAGSVTSIGAGAFYFCYSLSSVTIPDSVTSIGASSFARCYALASVTIPDSVTSIGTGVFSYCNSLSSITIPESVTSIGEQAFNYCYSLSSITIPESVTSIGNTAFSFCYSLSSVTIPKTVTTIGTGVFNSCFALKSAEILGTITSIDTNLFNNCYALSSVTIPETVTSIGNYAFYQCYPLASIKIPESVTSIGQYSFANCYSLASITIPETVTSIANYAFQNCNGMAEYHFLSTTPPTLGGTSVFSGIPSDCKIYVPAASLDTYKTTSRWSTHASKMVGE